jgi:cytochrome c oxidase cbb3-type subunit III
MNPACAVALFVAACLLASCEREQRGFREATAASASSSAEQKVDIQPGAGTTTAPNVPTNSSMSDPYEFNAYGVSEGARLYNSYNCVGCHAHGGGGMGVPLIDKEWLYGYAPREIYNSIVEGRPNGMPSFRGKIPDYQVWQLVAYVRSMSGQLRKDVAPGRTDHMSTKKPASSTPREPQTGAKP